MGGNFVKRSSSLCFITQIKMLLLVYNKSIISTIITLGLSVSKSTIWTFILGDYVVTLSTKRLYFGLTLTDREIINIKLVLVKNILIKLNKCIPNKCIPLPI